MRNFLHRLATLGPVGFLKPGPGTWGTLASMPLVFLLAYLGPFIHMIFALFMVPLSILSAEIYEQESASHDAKEVVIDETVGVLIAMVWLPLTWQSFVAGFVLFRILDIL